MRRTVPLKRCFLAMLAAGMLPMAASGPALAQQPIQPSTPAAALNAVVQDFGAMWTFEAPPVEYWQSRYGFTATRSWLDSVRLASVRLPPGCSGSFVSAQGLILTNHHCVLRCLAAISTPDSNFRERPFVAGSLREERKCAGFHADQLQSIEDVTVRIRRAIRAKSPTGRMAQRDSIVNAVETSCAAETGLICQVVSYLQGGAYSLYRFKRYDDLRLVVALRTDGFLGMPVVDLALFRAYQDGRPLQSAHYFTLRTDDVADGDLVFTVGNTGWSGRLLPIAQMRYLREVQYPDRIANETRTIRALRALSPGGEMARRRLDDRIQALERSVATRSQYLAHLNDSATMARKHTFEHEVRRRVEADPALRARFGHAWNAMETAESTLIHMDSLVRWYSAAGSSLFEDANNIVLAAQQASLPDARRMPKYRGNGLAAARTAVLTAAASDLDQEKTILAAWLTDAQRSLPADDPFLAAILAGRDPEAAAEALINGTKLADSIVRKALLDGGAAAVAGSHDSLIVVARRVEPIVRRVLRRAGELADVISANAELIGQAIYAVYGKPLPSDATFTPRISDGVVSGASEHPADSAAPRSFPSTNDVNKGNSGGPTINRRAEIVGLAFYGFFAQQELLYEEDVQLLSLRARSIVQLLQANKAARIVDELHTVGAGTP